MATVGKTVEGGAATLTVEQLQGIIAESIKRHGERNPAHVPALVPVVPQLTRKQLRKAAASMGLAVTEPQAVSLNGAGQPSQPGLSAAELKALLTEQFTPLAQQYQNQMDDLRKQVDEIGARPDPAMAPVRGALAKAPADVATPVERRSLVDEAAETANKMAAAQEAHYRAYVEALAKSPDPGVREAALATLDKLSAGTPAGVGG